MLIVTESYVPSQTRLVETGSKLCTYSSTQIAPTKTAETLLLNIYP